MIRDSLNCMFVHYGSYYWLLRSIGIGNNSAYALQDPCTYAQRGFLSEPGLNANPWRSGDCLHLHVWLRFRWTEYINM